MAQSLKGKVALITGAGKGIGRSTAIELAKEGVNIGLIARTESDLKAVASELEAFDVQVAYATADVSSMEEVNAAVEHLHTKLGATDILINNAGIGKFGSFLELDPAEWKQIIDVNLMGVYYVTRAVLPQLIEKNGGDIINISSTAGQKGAPVTSAYSASKFGVLGLTESLALEVRKHNIRVTALTPSTVATELAYKENLTDGNPDKVMQPEDLAEIMVAQLKLHPRIFIKSAGMWSTNP
ncbi:MULTISPECIES: 3-ketoacyl-ACP reductase [Priestia]|jgi:3-oxoacyl-[acyl-carrier protein] reductase|uniref:glucose 1-dehydrogenase [NAD(P)(+)] n=3 Tax=Priestia TaxID=2800373 RepID=D5DZD8_PRIM1|nr:MULTISPECIES: 3-ketoacyl-ACP reductase [Priestia]AVX07368.1 3-ketoacyl-ACP reductase [Bacillus sp. Y-01]KOP73560.1 3-ketoacyl-ACP reductase [Bacillus sp. FJAT-21351]KQU26718.1 3-ketoacyl-ACP reductase [Bacillus sp. Leaf75]KRF53188.1 3-ketoacyl-ACP reductase [Bacillus sp. Soil531]MBZ5479202.1 3-ketoacyl-ACP reductase [Bacillus sp. T_4]MCF6795129.1 3-ketoacyl-ACP reductase [Bacillus sp. ET1]MCJ7987109.1 3-ketoacyl-ACP reductase [Priestia sp. OVL9]MDH6655808.1 3-oxoacyl-[acyl-carrier protei